MIGTTHVIPPQMSVMSAVNIALKVQGTLELSGEDLVLRHAENAESSRIAHNLLLFYKQVEKRN